MYRDGAEGEVTPVCPTGVLRAPGSCAAEPSQEQRSEQQGDEGRTRECSGTGGAPGELSQPNLKSLGD